MALQDQHDDAAARAAPPLLALFDPGAGALHTASAVNSTSGYAGDVAATAGGWLVSCPREHQVWRLRADGGVERALRMASACALVAGERASAAWVLGGAAVLGASAPATPPPTAVEPEVADFDNHSASWRGPQIDSGSTSTAQRNRPL